MGQHTPGSPSRAPAAGSPARGAEIVTATLLDTDDDLEEMVSYRKNVTGVAHTVFISPKGNARHAPRIKVAVDPPDSLDPRSETVSIGLDGLVMAGTAAPDLLRQARRFIVRNSEVLLDYWEYRIDTDELRRRLRSIEE